MSWIAAAACVVGLTASSASAIDPNVVYTYGSFEQFASGVKPANAFKPGLSLVYYPVGGTAGAPIALTDDSVCGHATFEPGTRGTLDWMIVAVGCAGKAKQCKTPAILDQGSRDWTLGGDGFLDIQLPLLTPDLLAQVPNKCCPALAAELTATDAGPVEELFFICGTASQEFLSQRGQR
jgi:hypothetical protein